MTKKSTLLTCLAAVLFGCATLSQPSLDVKLSDVEHLQMGVTTSRELRSVLGSPDQVVPSSDAEELWVYFDRLAKEPFQRASFVIDRKRNLVLSAAWIPGSTDLVQDRDAALEYFRQKASFELKHPPVIGHAYSNEVIFIDPQKALSLRVSETSHVVSVIGFGIAERLSTQTGILP